MMHVSHFRWLTLVALNVVLLTGTWWYSQSTAAPPETKQPFANPVQQREAMIRLLEDSNRLLQEQNALLKSGKLKVEISEVK